MSQIIAIDCHTFSWGIRGVASPGQESKIQQAKDFFTWVDSRKWQIALPAPLISEIISPVPVEDQKSILGLINQRFIVYPFDYAASIKCGELLQKSYTESDKKQYRLDNAIPKQKMKYDCMIVAICIVRKVHALYSNDTDLVKFADGQVSVLSLPNLSLPGTQTNLFGK